MEGKTALLVYLKKEIERRQIKFTEENKIEIDLNDLKYYIIA